MKRLGSRSWRIGVGASFFLSPPLFVREACGLSLPGDPWRGEAPWPPAFLAGQLTADERAAARQDWPAWWAAMLAFAHAQANSRTAGQGPLPSMRTTFDPPGFHSLAPHPALQRACRLAWPPYIHWWQMPAGGSMALEAGYNVWHRDTVHRIIRQFEARQHRKAKPFSLQIELVYPQTQDTYEDGEDFAVLAAGCVFRGKQFEEWLTERIEAIG